MAKRRTWAAKTELENPGIADLSYEMRRGGAAATPHFIGELGNAKIQTKIQTSATAIKQDELAGGEGNCAPLSSTLNG